MSDRSIFCIKTAVAGFFMSGYFRGSLCVAFAEPVSSFRRNLSMPIFQGGEIFHLNIAGFTQISQCITHRHQLLLRAAGQFVGFGQQCQNRYLHSHSPFNHLHIRSLSGWRISISTTRPRRQSRFCRYSPSAACHLRFIASGTSA